MSEHESIKVYGGNKKIYDAKVYNSEVWNRYTNNGTIR